MNGRRHLGIVIAVIRRIRHWWPSPRALAQGRCSVATLKGSYGVVEQGTIVMDGVMGLPVGSPTANVALVTYDGAGNLSATYQASYGGMPLSGSLQGTYRVDPDCTYYDSVPTVQLERKGTIVGEGMLQEVHAILHGPLDRRRGNALEGTPSRRMLRREPQRLVFAVRPGRDRRPGRSDAAWPGRPASSPTTAAGTSTAAKP